MKILDTEIENKIAKLIIKNCINKKYDFAIENISKITDELYDNIPDNKRISYGKVHTIKVLSQNLFNHFREIDEPVFEIASNIFEKGNDFRTKGVALGILAFIGSDDYRKVLPYFESAAADDNWDVREMAQMFFKKLIKKYPDEMKEYLLKLVKSEDANIRRFVAETLRPVQENRWFYKQPDYPLSILSNLFQETAAYPRTAVGNNLSDLARRLPDLVYELVEELVQSGDKNSYWIAYRACRNLVKKEPIKVMDLLQVDEYKYKNRIYRRIDYQGN
ncbi:MAG: DNA alkylation repair protein [bacterium]|nr:MAG: DNA alkylation repair protein [bacterium]